MFEDSIHIRLEEGRAAIPHRTLPGRGIGLGDQLTRDVVQLCQLDRGQPEISPGWTRWVGPFLTDAEANLPAHQIRMDTGIATQVHSDVFRTHQG